MQTVLHMLRPFNVKFSSSSRAITFPGTLGSSLTDLGCCPGISGPFGWAGSGAAPAGLGVRRMNHFFFAISKICYLLTQLRLQKEEKPYDVINKISNGAGQSSVQIAINYRSSQRIGRSLSAVIGMSVSANAMSCLMEPAEELGPVVPGRCPSCL